MITGQITNPMMARVLSRPFPVWWAGWETTTTRLQQMGWKLAVQFEYYDMNYRLALQHEQLCLMAISDATHIEHAVTDLHHYDHNLPPFNVTHVAKSLMVYQAPPTESLTPWHLIDARPQLCELPIRKMEDFSVFAKAQPQEVLVADMSVVEHLEAIIRAQEPKQHELRQRILNSTKLRPIASIAEVA